MALDFAKGPVIHATLARLLYQVIQPSIADKITPLGAVRGGVFCVSDQAFGFIMFSPLTLELLENRWLLAVDPSPQEQEMLELINRMRTNPAAELALLTKSSDADVNAAIAFFKVNMTVLAQQWAKLDPAQPLAWNDALYKSAKTHSNLGVSKDSPDAQLPGEKDLVGRITDAGYVNYSTAGENVFANMKSVFYGDAAFAIDWGSVANGIQNPPGHRQNIMNDNFREIGVGIASATTKDTKVGPLVLTEDFGNRTNLGNPYFLGVVYNDKNKDGFYEAGEGIAGAKITLTNGKKTYTATSMTAGGYQIQVPAGTYDVVASGDGLGGTVSMQHVVVSKENVQRDFRADQATFFTVANHVATITGTPGNDTMTLSLSKHNFIVTRNGKTQTIAAMKDVKQINISLGDGNDTLTVGPGIFGVFCESGLGNDTLTGGDGNDTLTGGGGKDLLIGGAGDDRLNGLTSPDQLLGGDGNDRLYGGDGNDVMDGGGGVDRLFGGNNDDSLIGSSSNDKLYGESGNDTLSGGKGADLMDGGDGNDTAFIDDADSTVNIEVRMLI